MLRFNPIGFFPVGSLRAAARGAISGDDYQPADSDRVRPERSPRLRGAPQVQDEMDRDARRPVAKAVAISAALICKSRISPYLSPRLRGASAIEKSPLLPPRSQGPNEKALTNQGPYEERATGLEPATSSLGIWSDVHAKRGPFQALCGLWLPGVAPCVPWSALSNCHQNCHRRMR